MGDKTFRPPGYPECNHIRKQELIVPKTDEIAPQLSEANDTVLPLFEKRQYDYTRMKNSSLKTNELLKCRWNAYLQNIQAKRVRTPFQFPDISNYHYSNYLVRYNTSKTISKQENICKNMRVGPGVDIYGQLPIPEDLHVRKTPREKISHIISKRNRILRNMQEKY